MKDYKFDLALNTYRSLTGDYDTVFDTTNDIYIAIGNAVDNDGDATIINPLDLNITENGTYEFKKQGEVDAYEPVTINVNIDNEDVYNQGYNDGFDSGIIDQKSKLEDIEITSNGMYSKEDGYKNVTVKVSSDGLDFSIIGYDSELSKELNEGFQADIDYSKSLYDKYNGVLSGNVKNLFENDVNLVYCPNFDTSNVTNMIYMFRGCTNLQTIPQLNTGNVKIMQDMFRECTNLQTIPQLNTSNVSTMGYMFYNCPNLQTIPQLNTSNVTNMKCMFRGCTNLQLIPLLDTGKVTDMSSMFYGCANLQLIPLLDTGKVTDMSSMFYNCKNLQTIPLLDTGNATTLANMFYSCEKLTAIPLLDASNVTNIYYTFYNCAKLVDMDGLKNLGMQSKFTGTSAFSSTTNLTHDSVMNIINNLYDRAAAGYSIATLPLGSKNLARISADEKAIATNKGWALN